MTFEEFFAKKKIDLVLFEKADPNLFNEFRSHFLLMGEKSFDHTKKFWFNKLRGLYHLPGPAKNIPATKPAIVTQAEPLSSPTIEQKPAFKPRFKSTVLAKAESSEEKPEGTPISKPAFKPRNIPVKAPKEPPAETNVINDNPPAKKPAFRPRNIPTKTAESISEEGSSSSIEVPKKPGFKPRNIQAIAKENTVENTKPESQPEQETIAEIPAADTEKAEELPKQGYKPKFKFKNIQKSPAASEEQSGSLVKQEAVQDPLPEIQTNLSVESEIERKISSATEEKTTEQKIQENDVDFRDSADDKPLNEAPKPALKPKFKLKNIKPKSEE